MRVDALAGGEMPEAQVVSFALSLLPIFVDLCLRQG
jgi:hypothetical protein